MKIVIIGGNEGSEGAKVIKKSGEGEIFYLFIILMLLKYIYIYI